MARKKSGSRRSSRGKSKRRVGISATSGRTGITHAFVDADALLKLVRDEERRWRQQLRADLLAGATFWGWLRGGPPIDPTFRAWTTPLYRIMYGGLDPLSIAGSLAYGGRFNIGGAQHLPSAALFPDLAMGACIYGASSLNCARAEAGAPRGLPEEYELRPTRTLQLWDLASVITALPYPDLPAQVNATPMAAIWVMQKSPKISQLLATHLRGLGGDGIVYPSTKVGTEQNVAVFAASDAAAYVLLTATRLNP